ncbi:carbon starvation CstA family protein [Mollicutes bacterium LVI A0039]|nr:carbon starvation CstA family protein [Mollicutes bacterium LVI A0039]
MILLFFIGLVILIGGYKIYGDYVERQLGVEENYVTPAIELEDGIDFVPIDKKKNQLIQLLNIAGTGPIYGPIAAAVFGPIVLIMIPLGNIFFGAVQDYTIGFMSMRNHGNNLPSIAAKYIGKWSRIIFTIFTSLLLILVATVFVTSPAELISTNFGINYNLILLIIFVYYILSTIMPIDKIIGKFYPFITGLLIAGTSLVLISVLGQVLIGNIVTPEFTMSMLFTWKDQTANVILPGFFVMVSCGFISGFHTTQSPIIAKTMKTETEGKSTFYGMMVAEGFIAMVWALITMLLFEPQAISASSAPALIPQIATIALGSYLSWLIVLAVIVLPITSGDTAFRSLRTVIAEIFKFDQTPTINRVFLAIPIFFASFLLITAIDFSLLWQYFTWANHLLAVIALLTATAYLKYRKRNFWMTLVPGFLLFIVDLLYLITDKTIGFGMESRPMAFAISIGGAFILTLLIVKNSRGFNIEKSNDSLDDYELDEL